MYKVLIVEDQRIQREYLKDHLARSGRYEVTGAIENAAMADLFLMSNRVDLVLMDIITEHDENGLDAAAVIKKNHPDTKVIMVTSMVEAGYIDRARESGADSFWYKDTSEEELISVIDRTMEGEHIFPEKTPVVEIGLAKSDEFTKGEMRVLRLLVEGLSYEEIAAELGIKATTVRYHVDNMLQKTGIKNKVRLVIAVANKKLIIPTGEYED